MEWFLGKAKGGDQVFVSRKARETESYVMSYRKGEREPKVTWRRGGCCAQRGQSLAVCSDDGDQRWPDISNYLHSSLYFSARDLHVLSFNPWLSYSTPFFFLYGMFNVKRKSMKGKKIKDLNWNKM